MTADQCMGRVAEIRNRLTNLSNARWIRENPLSAAELDLERKVLANDVRISRGVPRAYVALYY